ncbi:hypothetical protein BDV93DRAFT_521434 [Ceratobasidium sp. AG-I]|nr:hypothetical protein BDV93DRAFT_529697 [Ceratobasidium sp. AG-I]KAF8605597.1 hypothetical protein BDV93DRAFT_521434 [Ceratobasidium sp. AG-I]
MPSSRSTPTSTANLISKGLKIKGLARLARQRSPASEKARFASPKRKATDRAASAQSKPRHSSSRAFDDAEYVYESASSGSDSEGKAEEAPRRRHEPACLFGAAV